MSGHGCLRELLSSQSGWPHPLLSLRLRRHGHAPQRLCIGLQGIADFAGSQSLPSRPHDAKYANCLAFHDEEDAISPDTLAELALTHRDADFLALGRSRPSI